MKKILAVLISGCLLTPAFAAETTVTFDKTKMKCGNVQIHDGMNKKNMHSCKGFQDKKTEVVFHDDNSGKTVECTENKAGNISEESCKTI